jgi:hypothetical protein
MYLIPGEGLMFLLKQCLAFLQRSCFALAILYSHCGLMSGADQVITAIHKQGSMCGYLVLKSAGGKIIGVGDQVSVAQGDQVRSRLVFRFNDGSVDEENTVFKQGKTFQLITDHHVQKGPSFPDPLDMTVNVPARRVTWKEIKDGKSETKSETMDLPADLANGMISIVTQNFPPKADETKVSYLTVTSKPRVVQLSIKPDDQDQFRIAGKTRQASRFNVHVELGGVTGVIAPVLGQQPSDVKIWVVKGPVPTFIRMRGPLYQKGPVWIAELTAPVWEASTE